MKKIATLLLVLLTVTLTGCKSKNTNDYDQLVITTLADQLNAANANYDKLKEDMDTIKAENSSLISENNDLRQQLDNIKLNNENSASNNQQTIDNLTKQINDLKKQLEDAYNNKSTTSGTGNNSYYEQTINSLNVQIADLKKQLQAATSSSSYPELQNQIYNLTMDLQNYKQLATDLQNQLAEQVALNSPASSSYLAIKFWSDGFTYTANVKWYCDPNCTKSAGDNITITSPVVSQDKLSNGYTVYTCMSSNGLVYASNYPYLKKIK